MEFTIQNGQTHHIDPERWMISKNPRCQIVGEDENAYTIVNANGIRGLILKELVRANKLPIKGNQLRLTAGLYEECLVKPYKKQSANSLSAIFRTHAGHIIRNRALVYQRAEYFLLHLPQLHCSLAYTGNYPYGLGALLEAWEYLPDFHFDEFGGYEDMYLVSVSGSPLSGNHSTIFWSAAQNELLYFDSKSPHKLPLPLNHYVKLFHQELIQRYPYHFDLNDVAMELLLHEINPKNQTL
jgi:hypothetical protein